MVVTESYVARRWSVEDLPVEEGKRRQMLDRHFHRFLRCRWTTALRPLCVTNLSLPVDAFPLPNGGFCHAPTE